MAEIDRFKKDIELARQQRLSESADEWGPIHQQKHERKQLAKIRRAFLRRTDVVLNDFFALNIPTNFTISKKWGVLTLPVKSGWKLYTVYDDNETPSFSKILTAQREFAELPSGWVQNDRYVIGDTMWYGSSPKYCKEYTDIGAIVKNRGIIDSRHEVIELMNEEVASLTRSLAYIIERSGR